MVDVAKRAGVALRTVSRVVNAAPNVAPDLVERVQAAIDELGYRPDEQARQLRRGVSGTIGVVARDVTGGNPIFREIEMVARRAGLMVLAASTEDDERLEHQVIMSMVSRRVDGIIFEPIGNTHDYLGPEIAAGMAFAAIDRPVAGADIDCVRSDNIQGIQLAWEHLRSYGHRRIAYIGDDERIFTGHERAQTFRTLDQNHGSAIDGEELVFTGPPTAERVRSVLAHVLDSPHPPSAILTGNGLTTFEVLRVLATRSVPRPALLGFDDIPLADLLQPGLSVIAQNAPLIAERAVTLLQARIADRDRPTTAEIIPVSLIARGSGETAP